MHQFLRSTYCGPSKPQHCQIFLSWNGWPAFKMLCASPYVLDWKGSSSSIDSLWSNTFHDQRKSPAGITDPWWHYHLIIMITGFHNLSHLWTAAYDLTYKQGGSSWFRSTYIRTFGFACFPCEVVAEEEPFCQQLFSFSLCLVRNFVSVPAGKNICDNLYIYKYSFCQVD